MGTSRTFLHSALSFVAFLPLLGVMVLVTAFVSPTVQQAVGFTLFFFNRFGLHCMPAAVSSLEFAAKHNQSASQTALGAIFRYGNGVPANSEAAKHWFELAARGSDVDAQRSLADIYFGEGNFDKAEYWLKRAASQGISRSENELALFYFCGPDSRRNLKEGLGWAKKAASHGNAESENLLGNCFERGVLPGASKTEATLWYQKAASQGLASAQNSLAIKLLSDPDSREQAVQLLKVSADHSYLKSELELGTVNTLGAFGQDSAQKSQELLSAADRQGSSIAGYLLKNPIREHDLPKVVAQIETAANSGNAHAQALIGMLNELGIGVTQNSQKALQWYQKAANGGDADAEWMLGEAYSWNAAGKGPDFAMALKWLAKSADEGNSQAQVSLARMYRDGCATPQDNGKSVAWLQKASQSGNPEALYELGLACYRGEGARQSVIEAHNYLTQSAEEGNVLAQHVLARVADGGNPELRKSRAEGWEERAAAQGYIPAQILLDNMFRKKSKDTAGGQEDSAPSGLERAAEEGDVEAQVELGTEYKFGLGQKQDQTKAFALDLSAANAGYAKAQFQMGNNYRFGWGVKKNPADARKWYQKAADQGLEEAARDMKMMDHNLKTKEE